MKIKMKINSNSKSNTPVCGSQTGIIITMCRVDGRMAYAPQAMGSCIKNKRLPDSGSLSTLLTNSKKSLSLTAVPPYTSQQVVR
jgi:hypothetical protein